MKIILFDIFFPDFPLPIPSPCHSFSCLLVWGVFSMAIPKADRCLWDFWRSKCATPLSKNLGFNWNIFLSLYTFCFQSRLIYIEMLGHAIFHSTIKWNSKLCENYLETCSSLSPLTQSINQGKGRWGRNERCRVFSIEIIHKEHSLFLPPQQIAVFRES